MAHTRRTLKLDPTNWDIGLDGAGHIVVIAGAFATAQNVANEARLFTNDAYFAQDQGIPHFVIELGRRVQKSVLRSYLRQAALKVPDVAEVLEVDVDGFDPASRVLTGDIQFKTVEDSANGAVRTDF